ncbi:hypothetical protein OK348_15865 [Flavobacterium sp. MXW15]|uniref:Uncharacterized protein n=1 Tax=Xanthomonas chitinilytica TaxID=2989819 RepID=A0ABT3JZR2_9XANT|nr:hypothetical protein [Xanthomonas sp. H13-6]MCW4456263.1 hypothetical protein [Flavobacterium sp. MXW15]MCW4473969.1 hypothetical protein [Xanthomonas sp. H13-6]
MDGVPIKPLPFHGSGLAWPVVAWRPRRFRQARGRIVIAGLLAPGLPTRLFNPPSIDVLRLRP